VSSPLSTSASCPSQLNKLWMLLPSL
jgi:hypothetical protein